MLTARTVENTVSPIGTSTCGWREQRLRERRHTGGFARLPTGGSRSMSVKAITMPWLVVVSTGACLPPVASWLSMCTWDHLQDHGARQAVRHPTWEAVPLCAPITTPPCSETRPWTCYVECRGCMGCRCPRQGTSRWFGDWYGIFPAIRTSDYVPMGWHEFGQVCAPNTNLT